MIILCYNTRQFFSRRIEHGVPENELGIARSRELMKGANQVSHASKTHFIYKVQSMYHVFERVTSSKETVVLLRWG